MLTCIHSKYSGRCASVKMIYRVSSIVLIVLSCVVVGIFYVLTINNIEKIYTQDTYQVVYDFKRDYIRDTVENQIAEIERLRNREVLTFSCITHLPHHFYRMLRKISLSNSL